MIQQWIESIANLGVWAQEFLGNTAGEYAIAFGVFIGLLILFKIIQRILVGRLRALAERTKTDIDDTAIEVVRSVKPPFYSFVALYIALQLLTLDSTLERIVEIILIAWIIYQLIVAGQIISDYILQKRIAKTGEPLLQSAANTMSKLIKFVLWVFGVLLILSNLGVNITSLIAGLGIGGVAVAFALQNILGDLFSSFAIYFDKPFVPGDFIVVGNKKGVVQRIGVKTTRIRSLGGEELIIPNKEITSVEVRNFKRMEERRVAFSFGVRYETPQEKLERIPWLVKSIIEEVGTTRFDRAHFMAFGDSSLNFEVAYYVLSPDYNTYMDINQAIHFGVNKVFAKEGIGMAYPTRTVYLHKE